MSQRTLYDLAGADPALRFSPFCWRIKLALAHKRLDVETIPWRFTEKEVIAFSGQKLVPVLVDGERVVTDSQAIAEYLEATYPDAPSLFGDAQSRALIQFIRRWTDGALHLALAPILMPDIHRVIHPKDQDYFRASREQRFGTTLETLAAQREQYVAALQTVLNPLRFTVKGQAFLAGETPLYADHLVFGALQWARKTSATPLLQADDPIIAWMERVLDFYGDTLQR